MASMKRIRIVLLLGLIYWFSTSISATAQLSIQGQPPTLPEVQAKATEDIIVIDHTRSGTFRIAVHIPQHHHGYLNAGDEGLLIPLTFTFPTLEARKIRINELSRPSGERDNTAHATVLRGNGEFTFNLDATVASLAADEIFSGDLLYQICNDETNICYAPRKINVPLNIDFSVAAGVAEHSTTTDQVIPSPPAVSLTTSEHVTTLFQRYMRHSLLAIGLVFIAGLIASATPCVYPILPITSAILMARGRGSRQRGQLHAMVYFTGIILFYTLLGLLAAITGNALSAVMTNAWVNLSFAILFTYFGLSMLGLYEFHFLSSFIAKLDNASARQGGLFGTLIMGLTAGLVASPCVGPVAGAILLQITGQTATTGSDTIFRGITLMTSFGAGLGLPFLVIGLVSHRLPQSGPWLTKIKFCLGIPILYFAYTYYLKGVETAGISTDVAHAILIGIIAIGAGVFIGALHHHMAQTPSPGLLMRRALGIVLLIVGTHFLYNGMGRSGILLENSTTIPNPTSTNFRTSSLQDDSVPQVEIHGNLQWLRDFSLAQQRASAEHKPLFIDFYATWCANCKAFQRLSVTNRQLNQALQQTVLVKIYDTDEVFKTFQQNRHYPELGGIGGQPFLPLFAIYSPDGALTWKGQDYKAVGTMVAQIEHARRVTVQSRRVTVQ
jgi:thiol:disulfide interchange protein DsbD